MAPCLADVTSFPECPCIPSELMGITAPSRSPVFLNFRQLVSPTLARMHVQIYLRCLQL